MVVQAVAFNNGPFRKKKSKTKSQLPSPNPGGFKIKLVQLEQTKTGKIMPQQRNGASRLSW